MKNTFIAGVLIILVIFLQHKGTAQWVQSNGLTSGTTYALIHCGTDLFAGTYGKGIYRSTDNGSNWIHVDSTITGAISLASIGSTLFAGNVDMFGNVSRSIDNGATWTNVLSTLGAPRFGIVDSTLFTGPCGGGPVRRTTDFGYSWDPVNTGITMSWVEAFGTFGSEVFVSTESGHLFQSSDYGNHWSETGYSGATITSIHVKEGALFVGTQSESPNFGSVYRSTDNGLNWVNMGMDTFHISGCNITSILSIGSNVFAGTNGVGVYLSTNNGVGWVNVGLENNAAWQLLVVGNNLVAGTSSGIWKRALSEMITGVDDSREGLPSSFALLQNYPNPFNPSTLIQYQLPTSGLVRLTVFNSLGQTVATLFNGYQEAGNKQAIFASGELPSGVYFYRLEAGTFSDTKKMILMR